MTMGDSRSLILSLATSSVADQNSERVAQLITESAELRQDLGGSLGVEAGKRRGHIVRRLLLCSLKLTNFVISAVLGCFCAIANRCTQSIAVHIQIMLFIYFVCFVLDFAQKSSLTETVQACQRHA